MNEGRPSLSEGLADFTKVHRVTSCKTVIFKLRRCVCPYKRTSHASCNHFACHSQTSSEERGELLKSASVHWLRVKTPMNYEPIQPDIKGYCIANR